MTGPAQRRTRSDRLRVLVVGQTSSTPGGIAAVQRLHERFLAARDDVDVRVVTTYDEAGPLRRLRLMVGGITRALALVLGGRVDVVHLHVAKGLSTLRKGVIVAAARARGVPTVLHTHAGAFADWFDGLPAPLRPVVAWLLRADRVVVLAPDARAIYTTRLGLPEDRVVVLTNPVEWPATVPERDPGTRTVDAVFLGRLIDRKGVFDLVTALAGLDAAHRARLHVTLAGHGDADAVRRAVTANGLDGAVEVRTWIGPAERDALLGTAESSCCRAGGRACRCPCSRAWRGACARWSPPWAGWPRSCATGTTASWSPSVTPRRSPRRWTSCSRTTRSGCTSAPGRGRACAPSAPTPGPTAS